VYNVEGDEFSCWTRAQDKAVELLKSGVEYVKVLQWSENKKRWGLLQELNLERGIVPDTHFSTYTLAPYYVRNYYEHN